MSDGCVRVLLEQYKTRKRAALDKAEELSEELSEDALLEHAEDLSILLEVYKGDVSLDANSPASNALLMLRRKLDQVLGISPKMSEVR